MMEIIPFKTRGQLEKEKEVKVMRKWEEAIWHNVVDSETKEEQNLHQEEIEWLNEWAKKTV